VTRTALLDTSALITVVDNDAIGALDFDRLVISSLTYAELRVGFLTAGDVDTLRNRTRRFEAISRSFGAGLPFDDACAPVYERVVQAAVAAGQSPRTNAIDRMIAAIAARHHLPLVTRNATDLRGVDAVVDIIPLG